jgi:hypothetical protein
MRSDTEPQGMPRRLMSPETIALRITWRVAELRVLAAQTALNYAKLRTREAWEAFEALATDIDD